MDEKSMDGVLDSHGTRHTIVWKVLQITVGFFTVGFSENRRFTVGFFWSEWIFSKNRFCIFPRREAKISDFWTQNYENLLRICSLAEAKWSLNPKFFLCPIGPTNRIPDPSFCAPSSPEFTIGFYTVVFFENLEFTIGFLGKTDGKMSVF